VTVRDSLLFATIYWPGEFPSPVFARRLYRLSPHAELQPVDFTDWDNRFPRLGPPAEPPWRAAKPCTVVGIHDREGLMARRRFTMDRYQETERRMRAGRGLREIARALGCSRWTVREIRDSLRGRRLDP
jgi:hypothetical protein